MVQITFQDKFRHLLKFQEISEKPSSYQTRPNFRIFNPLHYSRLHAIVLAQQKRIIQKTAYVSDAVISLI